MQSNGYFSEELKSYLCVIVFQLSEALKRTLSGAPALVALYSASSFPDSDVSDEVAFKSFQYSLFTTCFVEVLGGFFFLITTIYIIEDRSNAEGDVTG